MRRTATEEADPRCHAALSIDSAATTSLSTPITSLGAAVTSVVTSGHTDVRASDIDHAPAETDKTAIDIA